MKIILVLFLLVVMSCTTAPLRRSVPQAPPQAQTASQTLSDLVPQTPEQPHVEMPTEKPKIGIILGPGAVRAFAHIGILQEIGKSKVPVHAIVGIELGALVGSIYASKGQAYDVEWQMFKIKEEEIVQKTFVGGQIKQQDISNLQNFLQTNLGNVKLDETRISFGCPALNLAKNQTIMMTKGPLPQALPYCLPFGPFYQPYNQNVAAAADLVSAAKFLRAKGANYLIYINLLPQQSGTFFEAKELMAAAQWSVLAQGIENQFQYVDKIVNIQLSQYTLSDFSKRREIMLKGQEAGRTLVNQMMDQFGY